MLLLWIIMETNTEMEKRNRHGETDRQKRTQECTYVHQASSKNNSAFCGVGLHEPLIHIRLASHSFCSSDTTDWLCSCRFAGNTCFDVYLCVLWLVDTCVVLCSPFLLLLLWLLLVRQPCIQYWTLTTSVFQICWWLFCKVVHVKQHHSPSSSSSPSSVIITNNVSTFSSLHALLLHLTLWFHRLLICHYRPSCAAVFTVVFKKAPPTTVTEPRQRQVRCLLGCLHFTVSQESLSVSSLVCVCFSVSVSFFFRSLCLFLFLLCFNVITVHIHIHIGYIQTYIEFSWHSWSVSRLLLFRYN